MLATLTLACTFAPSTLHARADDAVPDAVVSWFAEAPAAQDVVTDPDDLSELAEASPKVAKALAHGTEPRLGTIARVSDLDRPTMDLTTRTLSHAPESLAEALAPGDLYCAMIRVADLFTDADLCATAEPDGSVRFAYASYDNGFLDGITQLPAEGYVVTEAGSFSVDLPAQTLTVMDDAALQNVPQRTVSASDLITALARSDAERALLARAHPDAAGGTAPLFFATPAEQAEHDAEIAALLDQVDGEDGPPGSSAAADDPSARNATDASTPTAAEASSTSQGDGRSRLVALGVGVVVILLAGGVALVTRARRRRRALVPEPGSSSPLSPPARRP